MLSRRQSLFYVSQFFMRPQSPLFLIRKACFLFLSFLCDSGLRFSLSAKLIFSVSLFFPPSLPPLFLPSPPFLLVIMLLWSELGSQLVTPNGVRHRCLNRYITLLQLETIQYNTGTSINYVPSIIPSNSVSTSTLERALTLVEIIST